VRQLAQAGPDANEVPEQGVKRTGRRKPAKRRRNE